MMMLMKGETLTAEILLPDEASALVLRAFAWHVRGAGTDAVDLWRALEFASAASVQLHELGHDDALQARDIVRRAFLSPAGAMDVLQKARGLSRDERTRMGTRLRALASAVAGEL
jgi:hypothetical protein